MSSIFTTKIDKNPNGLYEGKTAIIVGGSSGIGFEISKYLIERGCNVSIISKTQEHLNEAKNYLDKINVENTNNAKIETLRGDVTKENFSKILDDAYKRLNIEKPDMIIYTAGISIPGKFGEIPISDYEKSMNVNYFGLLKTLLNYNKHIKNGNSVSKDNSKKDENSNPVLNGLGNYFKNDNDKGTIFIVISSAAAIVNTSNYSAYAPTKASLAKLLHDLPNEDEYKKDTFVIAYPFDVATRQLIEEDKKKSLEMMILDGSIPPSTPDVIAKYIMKPVDNILRGKSRKNLYEIIPAKISTRLSYYAMKMFPFIYRIAEKSAERKAKKLKEEGKEDEVLEKYRKEHKDIYNKYVNDLDKYLNNI